MCQHVSHRQLHQRGQTHCRTQVVSEHEERAAEHFQTAMQHDAVHGSSHTELANAEVQVAAIAGFRCIHRQIVQMCHCRAFQVGGAAQQLRYVWSKSVERVTGSYARGDRFVCCAVLRQLRIPTGWQIAGNRLLELSGQLRIL
ncbi:hypothetical protein D3C74_283830 [compost metagenome]